MAITIFAAGAGVTVQEVQFDDSGMPTVVPRYKGYILDEVFSRSGAPDFTTYTWLKTTTGTGALVTSSDVTANDATHEAHVTVGTGTTTSGFAQMIFGFQDIELGALKHWLESDFNLDVLSDGTNTYKARFGLVDDQTGAAANGVYFEADSNANANFQAVSRSASGATTTTDTGVVIGTGWVKLRVFINNSTARFYINGVLVATHITNVPSGASERLHIGFDVLKTAGALARLLHMGSTLRAVTLYDTPN